MRYFEKKSDPIVLPIIGALTAANLAWKGGAAGFAIGSTALAKHWPKVEDWAVRKIVSNFPKADKNPIVRNIARKAERLTFGNTMGSPKIQDAILRSQGKYLGTKASNTFAALLHVVQGLGIPTLNAPGTGKVVQSLGTMATLLRNNPKNPVTYLANKIPLEESALTHLGRRRALIDYSKDAMAKKLYDEKMRVGNTVESAKYFFNKGRTGEAKVTHPYDKLFKPTPIEVEKKRKWLALPASLRMSRLASTLKGKEE